MDMVKDKKKRSLIFFEANRRQNKQIKIKKSLLD